MDQRSLRQHRRRFVGVDVVVHPVKVEVIHIAQHPRSPVRQNGLHRHRLAAKMHVRLEILQAGGLLQQVKGLRLGDGIRRDIDPRADDRRWR